MISYKDAGVDYDKLDGFKVAALNAGLETAGNLPRNGFCVVPWSFGESVHLIETPFGYLGHVNEGLGTKCMVADEMGERSSIYYEKIGWDTASSALNDAITLGVVPLSLQMHVAVGDSDWFNNKMRYESLIKGVKNACDDSCCVWGGGETPSLPGMVESNRVVLSCSVVGIIEDKNKIMDPNTIEAGDSIIFIKSSGLHINGYSLARKLANQLREGYWSLTPGGQTYGLTLLEASNIYTRLVIGCLDQNIKLKYGINVSGHGFRKIMRHTRPFEYIIEKLPANIPPIFEFIKKIGNYDNRFMYETFNMGVGFVLVVPPRSVDRVLEVSKYFRFSAFEAGRVVESRRKLVVINPLNIEFGEEDLKIR